MQDTVKKKHKSGPTKSALTTPLSIRVPNAMLAEIAAAANPGDRVRGGGTAGEAVRRLRLCGEIGADRLRELTRRAAARTHPDGTPWTAGELLDELLAFDAAPPLPEGVSVLCFLAADEASVAAGLDALRPRGVVASTEAYQHKGRQTFQQNLTTADAL